METIEYTSSITDIEALSVYYMKQSPDGKRGVRSNAGFLGALILGMCLIKSPPISDVEMLVPAVIFSLAVALLYPRFYIYLVRASTRKRYMSGKNKTLSGWHRILLLDQELREENQSGSHTIRYDAIESIAETDTHLFIYVTIFSAHVIPKNAVSSGDLGSFVTSLRERMERAGGPSVPGFAA